MNYQPYHSNAPLIDFALKGLEKCWMPSEGRWSHIYHLDGRDQPNEFVPESDVFYTLNVLLGMTQVDQVPASHRYEGNFSKERHSAARIAGS